MSIEADEIRHDLESIDVTDEDRKEAVEKEKEKLLELPETFFELMTETAYKMDGSTSLECLECISAGDAVELGHLLIQSLQDSLNEFAENNYEAGN